MRIKRIYIRRYRDNDQVVFYVDWEDGSRTEAPLKRPDHPRINTPSFGRWSHAACLLARAEGLRLERETW